jgi:hypothetical protein
MIQVDIVSMRHDLNLGVAALFHDIAIMKKAHFGQRDPVHLVQMISLVTLPFTKDEGERAFVAVGILFAASLLELFNPALHLALPLSIAMIAHKNLQKLMWITEALAPDCGLAFGV